MKDRARHALLRLVRILGGITAGVALYLIGAWIMSIQVSVGIPPSWLWGTTVGFFVAYFLAAKIPWPRWRAWARPAALTGTILWALAWGGGWSGHGGSGYFEASRMFGHLYNVSYAARTGSDLEGVMTGLEWYREATDGYFGEPELTETGDGWYVVLVSPRSGRVCSVYRGSVGVWPAIREGLPRCRLPPPWDRLALFVALLLGGTVASVTAWGDASSTDVPLDQA